MHVSDHKQILVPNSPNTLCQRHPLLLIPLSPSPPPPSSTPASARNGSDSRTLTPYCLRQQAKGLLETFCCCCCCTRPPPSSPFSLFSLVEVVAGLGRDPCGSGGELSGGGCCCRRPVLVAARCCWSILVLTSSRLPQSLKSCSRRVERVAWFARRLGEKEERVG